MLQECRDAWLIGSRNSLGTCVDTRLPSKWRDYVAYKAEDVSEEGVEESVTDAEKEKCKGKKVQDVYKYSTCKTFWMKDSGLDSDLP